MNLTIVYYCMDCFHYNRSNLGCDGFVALQNEWISFSEAHKHLIENPEHYVKSVIEKESEEE